MQFQKADSKHYILGIIFVFFLVKYVFFYRTTEGLEGTNDWELTSQGSGAVLNYKGEPTFQVGKGGAIKNITIDKINKRIDDLTMAVGIKAKSGKTGAVGSTGKTGRRGARGPIGPRGPAGPAGSDAKSASIPKGVIVAFKGRYPPRGWAICDGRQGTPNLTNRFIMGGVNVGKTGGGKSWKMTEAQMAKHRHRYSRYNYGSHRCDRDNERRCHSASYSDQWSHWAGSGKAIPNSTFHPPYYILAYIMKL